MVIATFFRIQRRYRFTAYMPYLEESVRQRIWASSYVFSILTVIFLFELIPCIEEFIRGLRANHGALVPLKAREQANR
jgi:hypothetical protein